MRRAILGVLCLLSAGPASAAADTDAAALVGLLVGEYSNKPMVDAARAAAGLGEKLPPPLGEVHHMFATEVAMPKLGRHVVYVEWRHDDARGTISGQRVWSFTSAPEGTAMRFHTLRESGKGALSGVIAATEKTRDVGIEDLRPYPERCTIYFRAEGDGFVGENKPGTCDFPRTGAPDQTFKVDATLRILPELHGEKTTIWILKPGESTATVTPEIEDWVYRRIR